MATTELVKQQVVDNIPKRIKELSFGLAASQDFIKQGVIEVCDRALYDLSRDRAPAQHGPLDTRLGVSSKSGLCDTCGEPLQTCNGHFGYVKLALPAFHIGYFKIIIAVLQGVCKDCARILLPEKERRAFHKELRRPNIDNLRKTQICKRILKETRKTYICPECGNYNGKVKKTGTGPLKIVHERFSHYDASKAMSKKPPKAKLKFEKTFENVRKIVADIDRNIKKAQDDLNPLRVLNLFKRISSLDCELLGMNPSRGRPEMFIWQYFPIAPVCLRPSVAQDSSTTEDDITSKISDIIHINTLIAEGLQKGQPVSTIMEQWDFLQLQVAMIINSEVPGIQQPGGYSVAIRGFCQRLKGKQGRFRGNLSGKRVDFSGRTVISPDPNLGIDEVAVPVLVAKTMTYPEQVTRYNIAKMRKLVMNGPSRWPGATYIIKQGSGLRQHLKFGKASQHADHLKIGDIVERHLEDRDIVLFNRQPSLHKISIMSHRVKVRPSRTFRLNECACNPYNADFDGDEMNLHVPQTEEARTEATELMGVQHNLGTPRNGEPIIAAIQDFITGSYLLSSKDVFYDRKTFSHICMYMVHGNMQIDLPPPAILKPAMLWTGKQVFNVMMRPNKACDVLVNLDAPCREYRVTPKEHRDLNEKDSWLCIRNSEVMCGVMDKNTVGAGKKESVFYVIMRDYGQTAAVDAMNRLARLCARWLGNVGFSIGIGDVRPGENLIQLKKLLVEKAYAECDLIIEKYKEGKLERISGCDEEQTMESSISGILSKVRAQAGDQCFAELSKFNPPMIMAMCGSKGSSINVSQMVAVVGQQLINQERVQDGFQDRTLPHFPKNARQPPSKGFVRNSFFSGLTPSEFIFHAMSGREGLVDTAVKTAETGYMSRRLMKSLEDLSTQYDDTVRNSSGAIIQYTYGDDKLDPSEMEGKAKPVNFARAFTDVEAKTMKESDANLLPHEILSICEEQLEPERAALKRFSLMGKQLGYDDETDPDGADDRESGRAYLRSIEDFVGTKARERADTRTRLGLPDGLDKSMTTKARARNDKVKLSEGYVASTAKLSRTTLIAFIQTCLQRYQKSRIEPGSAVGAVGAQSIGEPGTQMTLKTFHFAGVGNVQVTQGVPRIKEIINASKNISTPIINCDLLSKDNITAARVVKGRIEQTFLRDVVMWIEDVWTANASYVAFELDFDTIGKLQLDLNAADIVSTILKYKKIRLRPAEVQCSGNIVRIDISPSTLPGEQAKGVNNGRTPKPRYTTKSDNPEVFLRVQMVKRLLPDIPISGYPLATRAIIQTDTEKNQNKLLVEGYGLRACLNTQGVNFRATRTNSIMETRDVLGIEAARCTIFDEISAVMGAMDIDPRHMALLADVMTYKGEILGITRHGLAKMRDSVLQLASFEKTPDHLFEAAWMGKRDSVEGVSECIIMGQPVGLGTGACGVVRKLGGMEGVGRKGCGFEEAWGGVMGGR